MTKNKIILSLAAMMFCAPAFCEDIPDIYKLLQDGYKKISDIKIYKEPSPFSPAGYNFEMSEIYNHSNSLCWDEYKPYTLENAFDHNFIPEKEEDCAKLEHIRMVFLKETVAWVNAYYKDLAEEGHIKANPQYIDLEIFPSSDINGAAYVIYSVLEKDLKVDYWHGKYYKGTPLDIGDCMEYEGNRIHTSLLFMTHKIKYAPLLQDISNYLELLTEYHDASLKNEDPSLEVLRKEEISEKLKTLEFAFLMY